MGLFDSLFGTKTNTTSLTEMLTDEQKQAQSILANLAKTGQIGGMNTGDLYGGSLGNFQLSGMSQDAVNRLYDMMNAGTPSAYTTAENTLTKLADTTFDPSDPSSGYSAYARQVAKATKDADDVINRESAITGNRFGDRIPNTKSDLAQNQSDLLATKLADLYNTSRDRAYNASLGLTSLGTAKNQTALQNLLGVAELGDLQRQLDTQKAQSQYEEWQRGRSERLGAVTNASNSLWKRGVDYGMKDLTTKSPSTFMKMLGEVSPVVGSYNSHKYGYDANQTSIADAVNLLTQMLS